MALESGEVERRLTPEIDGSTLFPDDAKEAKAREPLEADSRAEAMGKNSWLLFLILF